MFNKLGWSPNTRAWDPVIGTGTSSFGLHDTTHNPIFLYQFANNLLDSSGNGRDLSVVAGAARYSTLVPGVPGFFFEGSTYLFHNAVVPALQITGNITLEFLTLTTTSIATWTWISCGNPGAGSLANNTLYDYYTSGGGQGMFWEIGSGVDQSITNANPVPPARPVHVALVRDGYDHHFYLDGVLNKTVVAPSLPVGGANAKLYIGANVNGNNKASNMILASFKGINFALTADQVYDEYMRTSGLFYGPSK